MLDVLKKRCQIESQFRRRLVYISALATAPWNQPVITNPPSYKGVGGNLVDFAIARSQELGYQGRIGLHALPGALGFYRKLRIGLLDCGPDPEEPDTLVYSLDSTDRRPMTQSIPAKSKSIPDEVARYQRLMELIEAEDVANGEVGCGRDWGTKLSGYLSTREINLEDEKYHQPTEQASDLTSNQTLQLTSEHR